MGTVYDEVNAGRDAGIYPINGTEHLHVSSFS